MNKKQYKKLYRYYKSALYSCTKQAMNSLDSNMAYFITYLRFIRDSLILTLDVRQQRTNAQLLTLSYAIHEYELSVMCIHDYFILQNNVIVPKDSKLTYELAQKLYLLDKKTHIDTFWDAVKLYMEGEVSLNEITI